MVRVSYEWLWLVSLSLLAWACTGAHEVDPVRDTSELETPDGEADDGSVTPDAAEELLPGDCVSGATRCVLSVLQSCVEGLWQTETTCQHGCEAGECLAPPPIGTCAEPLAMTLGATLISTTRTDNANMTWQRGCADAYANLTPYGPETVFLLTLEAPTMVRFSVDPIDITYFGLYIRGTCAASETEAHSACGGSANPGGRFSKDVLLGTGSHYVVVDDFADANHPPGRFRIKAEAIVTPQCAGQVPRLLDLSTGTVSFSGDTATGASGTYWRQYDCPNDAISSLGKENIFGFAVAKRGRLTIQVTPTEPSDSKVGVYLRRHCGDRDSQIACGYTPGVSAVWMDVEALPAGAYWLFVDDFASNIDGPQTYDLVLNFE